ncbi:MAG: pirin family protein [Candidatus Omnitrophica bacterium]|nr:pirin family protein [Candidatus Omnitrophota bacterium]
MMKVRKSLERGHFDFGWLDTYHTFSFGDYQDPKYEGFRALRVINEDRVKPSKGFQPHSHRDMEIITYILSGALQHEDSLGNRFVIRRGEIQRMSAGTGITHSEFNASKKEEMHLLQIWILPEQRNIAPGYEQIKINPKEMKGKWKLLVSPEGKEGPVKIHQDASIFGLRIQEDQEISYPLSKDRHAWIQVAQGRLDVSGHPLEQGDGLAVSKLSEIVFRSKEEAELLLFDLA